MKLSSSLHSYYFDRIFFYKKKYGTNTVVARFASVLEKIKSLHVYDAGSLKDTSLSHLSVMNSFCVILADDDADDRQLFEEAVAEISAGITVLTTNDGSHLMAKLNSPDFQLPEIIFLDLNMAGKTGKECLQEIRNNSRLRDIPVIIYSTSGNMKDIQDTKLIGANSYIRKPDSYNVLIRIIKKAFSIDWENNSNDISRRNFLLTADAI